MKHKALSFLSLCVLQSIYRNKGNNGTTYTINNTCLNLNFHYVNEKKPYTQHQNSRQRNENKIYNFTKLTR
jgi:hypothetical protein